VTVCAPRCRELSVIGSDMSFCKDVDASFPDPERRHFTPDDAPRAARSTLGPGLMPAEPEPEPWQHHISRSHAAHTNRNAGAVLPATGNVQVDGSSTFATSGGGSNASLGPDSRWQSSYQAQTLGQESNDGVGTVAKRRTGKKQLPRPGEPARATPFATGTAPYMRAPTVRQDEGSIHDGTTRNSGHIPGYSGFVPTYDKQNAMREPHRVTHDKALFAENYASQMRQYNGFFK